MAGTIPIFIGGVVGTLLAVAASAVLMRYLVGRAALKALRAQTLGSQCESVIMAAAVADATLAGLPLAEAALSMNDHVFDALERWVVHTHGGWSLVDYVKEHHGTIFAPDNGFLDGLKGYVAESIVGDHFAALGHNVVFATTTNQPGWDLTIDGHEFQVKAGHTAAQAVQHHFSTYPDIPVITSPEAAAHLSALDPHAVLAVHDISSPHLEAATTHTLHGLDSIAHAGAFHIPIVTVGMSAFKELHLIIDGHTTFGMAATHVAADAIGVGAGLAAGAKAGVLAGAFAGPHGMAAGGFIGGIIGAVAGKFSAKAIKEAKLRGLIRNYNLEVQQARAQFEIARREAAQSFTASLMRWDDSLQRERKNYQRQVALKRRLLLRSRRYASFRLRAHALWTWFAHPDIRSEMRTALAQFSINPSNAAAHIATVADSLEAHGVTSAARLRQCLTDFVAVYATAAAFLDLEATNYTGIVERYDIDSRTTAVRLLSDLTERAKAMFSRATALMDEIAHESRALGKPIAAPRLAITSAESNKR